MRKLSDTIPAKALLSIIVCILSTVAYGQNDWKKVLDPCLFASTRSMIVTPTGRVIASGHKCTEPRYSDDNGATWKSAAGLPASYFFFKYLWLDNEIFAPSGLGLSKTADNGLTWTSVGPLGGEMKDIAISSEGIIYMLFTDVNSKPLIGIYKSSDKGQSWTVINKDFVPPAAAPMSIAVNSKGHLFIGMPWNSSKGGIYKSTDDGATWTKMTGTNLQGTDVKSITIDKNDRIIAGTWGKGLLISQDDGNTWTDINSALWGGSSSWIQQVVIGPAENLFVNVDGKGVFRSTDVGTTWTALNKGLPYSGEFVTNPVAMAVSANGYLFAGTNDKGTYTTTSAVIIYPQPVITTADELSAFTQNSEEPSAVQTYELKASYLTANVLVTPPAGFEISADGGVSWNTHDQPLTLSPAEGSLDVTIHARLNALNAGALTGTITHTSDGASPLNLSVSGTVTFPPVMETEGTFEAFTHTVGSPSNPQSYTITGNYLTDNIAITPPEHFEVSVSGTNTWHTQSDPLVVEPSTEGTTDIVISVRMNAVTAGESEGDIVNSTTGISNTIRVSGVANPQLITGITGEQVTTLSIAPNPASNQLVIHHVSTQNAAKIEIRDVIGNTVSTHAIARGNNHTTIDVSALGAGVYFVQYSHQSNVVTKRFIKR